VQSGLRTSTISGPPGRSGTVSSAALAMTDRLAHTPSGLPESTCPRCHPPWTRSGGSALKGSATLVESLKNGSRAPCSSLLLCSIGKSFLFIDHGTSKIPRSPPPLTCAYPRGSKIRRVSD